MPYLFPEFVLQNSFFRRKFFLQIHIGEGDCRVPIVGEADMQGVLFSGNVKTIDQFRFGSAQELNGDERMLDGKIAGDFRSEVIG